MDALSSTLLHGEWGGTVCPSSLDTLTPAQLAVAALRADLDALTRQRAYHAFLERRRTHWDGRAQSSQQSQSILDVPLDFAIPESLYSLSVAELLLLQFNPRCTASDEADAAAALFLQLNPNPNREDKTERKRATSPAGLRVECCQLRWDGGARDEKGPLELRVESDALAVWRGGNTLFRIESKDITESRYIAGADDGCDTTECTLSLDAAHVALNPIVSVQHATASIALGMLDAKKDAFVRLRTALSGWSEVFGFEVAVHQAPSGQEAMPPARSIHTPAVSGSTSSLPSRVSDKASPRLHGSPNTPTPLAGNKRRRSSFAVDELRGQPSRSDASRAMEAAGVGPWRFVGATPAAFEWHPGAFVRQFALLRAIPPKEDLDCPEFSPDELALLSRDPVLKKLPKLPPYPPDPAPAKRLSAIERLALEHIYHDGPHLGLRCARLRSRALPTERAVLLTNDYPELLSYVKIASKLIMARDALNIAYSKVLQSSLYPRRVQQTAETRDPVDDLISIVCTLYESPLYRRQVLLNNDGKLIREPCFTYAELGVGPHHRFDVALYEIVKYEEMAGAIA
ncbi:hypothetical protein JCM3770_001988 [Rhodotorula araucariae]